MTLSDKIETQTEDTIEEYELTERESKWLFVGDVRDSIIELEDEIIKLMYSLDFPQAGVHKIFREVFGNALTGDDVNMGESE